MGRDLLDLHAAFGTGNKHRSPRIAVHEKAQVQFLGDPRALFDQHAPHLSSLGPRLVRDQFLAEHLLHQPRHFVAVLRQLDAARLPPSAGMDLRLDDVDRGIQLGGPLLGRHRVLHFLAAGHRNIELRE